MVLASTPQEWFGVESIHDISELDMLRWRCAVAAARTVDDSITLIAAKAK
jgi:hypothetical protein